ncbi:MAG: hypothetical protein ACHQNT_10270 [Bacteroidia bacterium]
MLNKINWKILFWISGFVALISIGCYIYQFHQFNFSDTTNSWGNFGSYIGGVLGTLLSFVSILLILYSIREQKESSYKQQFESSFFNLVELHKNTIHNIEEKKGDLFLKSMPKSEETLKSYNLLKAMMIAENTKMDAYWYIQAYSGNMSSGLYGYNYRALNNHFIQTRDFLNILINNISDILEFINNSNLLIQEKEFYRRILKNNLSDGEKFFFILFFKQIDNKLKERFTVDEVKEICGPKEWMLKYLTLHDEFPFCIPGICVDDFSNLWYPKNHYRISALELFEKRLYYVVKLKNLGIKLIEYIISINNADSILFKFPNDGVSFRRNTYEIDINKYFKDFLLKDKSNPFYQPITFRNALKEYCDSNDNFELNMNIIIELNNKKFSISDDIKFQFQGNGEIRLNINSQENISWEQNWMILSFKDYSGKQAS